jgi:hypothetical protein
MTLNTRLQELDITPELWSRLLDHINENLLDPKDLSEIVIPFLRGEGCWADPEEVIDLVREVLVTRLSSAMDQFRSIFRDWEE